MVTSAQRLAEINKRLAELSPEDRKKAFFVQPSKIPKVTGVRVIDTATGNLGQSKFADEIPRDALVISITDPAIEASRRRRESKQEQRQLAQKEAEFEARRIAEGKIKPKDVVLTRKGSRVILTRLLQEKAQKKLAERLKAPTKAERIRAIERKQRILGTFEKQALVAIEEARPKRALELFSEKAIKQLGLGETPQGLLEITLRPGEIITKEKERKPLPFKITFDPKIKQERRVELLRTARGVFFEQPGLFRKTKEIKFVSGTLREQETGGRTFEVLGRAFIGTGKFEIAVIPGRQETIAPTILHEATHLIVPDLVSRVLPDPLGEILPEFFEKRGKRGLIPTTIAPLSLSLIPERKVVVKGGKVLAELPVTAEFRLGFEKQLGTGKPRLIGFKTPPVLVADPTTGLLTFKGGVLPFETIGEIAKEKIEKAEERVRPLTTRIFRTKKLEQEQKRIRSEINKLKGKKDRGSVIQRRFLKGELVAVSTEIRFRKQFAEQPIESALLFTGGAALTRGLALTGAVGKPVVKVGAGILGTLFVGTTALEVKTAAELGDIGAGAGIFGERLGEATAFIGGGLFASRFLAAPKRVQVLKAKELQAKFAETLETEGTSAKNLQRIGLTTEVKTRLTRFRRGEQLRRIKTPREVSRLTEEQLRSLLAPRKGKLKLVFGLEEPIAGKKVTFPTLFREIKPTIVRPKIEPEPFEIRIDGKVGVRVKEVTIPTDTLDVRVGDIKGEVDVKDLRRVIDPALFKRLEIRGVSKDITVLQREFTSGVDKLAFDVRAGIASQRARITGKVKKVRTVADIFGIDLFPAQEIVSFRPVRARLGFRPILGVSPIFEPSPGLLLPLGLLGFLGKRERKPALDLTRDLSRISGVTPTTISESITDQDVITDLLQISEQRRKGRRIREPIVDIALEEAQLPIVDVLSTQEQEPIIDVTPDLRRDLIGDVVGEPRRPTEPKIPRFKPRKKPKEIKKGRFEGYNALVKGRKGKQLKVNIRPLTKKSALSSSARVVDNSIAATGSVKKIISKIEPIDTKDKYFQINRDKFRTFRKRKGKRIPLKDKFIEKRGKRLDTRGEVRKITAARLIAQQRKKRREAISSILVETPRRRRSTVRFF